jgi:hypothetical protein
MAWRSAQCFRSSDRRLTILFATASRDAYGANHFALLDDGHAPIDRDRASE